MATVVVKPLKVPFTRTERLWPSVSHMLTPWPGEGHAFSRGTQEVEVDGPKCNLGAASKLGVREDERPRGSS